MLISMTISRSSFRNAGEMACTSVHSRPSAAPALERIDYFMLGPVILINSPHSPKVDRQNIQEENDDADNAIDGIKEQ